MNNFQLQESVTILNKLKESIQEGVAQAIHTHQLSNQKIVFLQNQRIRTVAYKVEMYKSKDGFYSYRVISSDREIIEKGKKYKTRSECLRAIRNSRRQSRKSNFRRIPFKTNFA
ncbi:hypothetical protein LPTSP2_04590 [Leptospira ellinghausenii]|uniref:Uncharacterized protein n=1 Tax=Leptospira ellinghausenii TaxID=1917822 RepID=A0A2P2D980_9LEPT|nr:hypothetical protein [Leptospira ellinghausenii]GBF41187.1 hypothetical protein LPTSP2_04590 [Leptospira ellinghausenii]